MRKNRSAQMFLMSANARTRIDGICGRSWTRVRWYKAKKAKLKKPDPAPMPQ